MKRKYVIRQEILNYLCNKFDENDKRYNGENILARLKTKL